MFAQRAFASEGRAAGGRPRIQNCPGPRISTVATRGTGASSSARNLKVRSASEDFASQHDHQGGDLWSLPDGWTTLSYTSSGPSYMTAGEPEPSPSSSAPTSERLPTVPSTFKREMWTLTNSPGLDLLGAGAETWFRLNKVYVILFGWGDRSAHDGIYSLRKCVGDEGLPQETIITFESEEDAHRYACLLEATMDHAPRVSAISASELALFCREQGYQCRLEPAGSLLFPPEFTVGDTDWERSKRLREGMYAVLEQEPDALPPGMMARYAGGSKGGSGLDLDLVRQQLEALLPHSSHEDGEDNAPSGRHDYF